MGNSQDQFCGNCGRPREAGKSACPYCGSPYADSSPPENLQSAPQRPAIGELASEPTVRAGEQPTQPSSPAGAPPEEPMAVPPPPGGYAPLASLTPPPGGQSAPQFPSGPMSSSPQYPPVGMPSSPSYPPPGSLSAPQFSSGPTSSEPRTLPPTTPGMIVPSGAPSKSGGGNPLTKVVVAETILILLLVAAVVGLIVHPLTGATTASTPGTTPTTIASTPSSTLVPTDTPTATPAPEATTTATPGATTTPGPGSTPGATATPGVITKNLVLVCTMDTTNCNDPMLVTIKTITIDTTLARMVWDITVENKTGVGGGVSFDDFTLTEPISGQKYPGALVSGGLSLSAGQTLHDSVTFSFVPLVGKSYTLTVAIHGGAGPNFSVTFDPVIFTF